MSVQAITWVLEDAPGLPPHLVGVMIGLANHADRDGRGAYPSQALLSKYARKSERSVRRDLTELEEVVKLIWRGDQRLVQHLRADERPVVWDLAMPLRTDESGGTHTSPRGGTYTSARTHTTGRRRPREGTYTSGPGGTYTSAYPSDEPSRTRSSSARARTRPVDNPDDDDQVLDKKISTLLGELTGTTITLDWAARVRRDILDGRTVRNPHAYVVKTIKGRPRDFLPGDRPEGAARPWCGSCDKTTRLVDNGGGPVTRCPACHPLTQTVETS